MDALVCPLCRTALTAADDPAAPVCPRDGKAGVPAQWWPVPAGLRERFTVIEPFAHGQGGSMYLVDEPETGRRGVLKILAPVAKDQLGERQRLRRELIKQATLARSYLVVPLASGETDGMSWLFREWLDGVSLEVRLSREGALPQIEALAIAAQVASALDELHRGGLLHRDVKPGHIFLQPSPQGIPRARLLDAGVVSPLMEHASDLEDAVGRALGAGDAQARAITDSNGQLLFGSAGYVAPEQLLGKLISFRSDLYSLGCCLYRMLTGRPAFAGDTVAATLSAQRYGELPPLPSELPNGVGALLRSILAKDPQQRPFSAQKLRRTLDPYLPDGALMEKQQETSTYEAVPRGTPSLSQPPQPSGTLRPPAPPSAPPGPIQAPPVQAPFVQGPFSNVGVPPAARSVPPTAITQREGEESTQQIELEQIEEMRSVPRAASSIPPPTPKSMPPSERTVPLRLEQILQVGSAQQATSSPPAREPLTTPPSTVGRSTVQGLGSPSASLARTMMGMAAPLPAPPRAEQEPAPEAPKLFSTLDEPLAQPTSNKMFEAPKINPLMKATLLGIGGGAQNSMDVTLERGAEDATIERGAQDTTLERKAPAGVEQAVEPSLEGMSASATVGERPSARPPRRDASFDRHDETEALALPASGPSKLLSSLFADRRKAMYVGGAIVGVGVLGVLVSALFSGSGDDAAKVASRTPAPVVAPLPQPVAPLKPEPSVEAAPPSTMAALPPAEPVTGTARMEAMAEPPRTVAAPTPREERHHRHREAKSKHEEAAPRAPSSRESKGAKTAVADAAADKVAQFEAARSEARNAYSAKNYKAAASAYEKASKLEPSHPGTFAGLGAARLQLGDNKAAVAAYQRAVQLSPDTSGFHAALGRAYLANGDRGKAVSAYRKALTLDPKNDAAKAALAQLEH